ncbi:MAG: hypothetical protein WD972_00465 [Candidatus Andersenbacteria bacterium]
MYIEYVYWQFVSGPQWLLTLARDLERALLRFFSVPFMVRTLFAYWRKDRVSYRAGSLEGIALALAWNTISRGIGFIIRTTVLVIWVLAAAVLAGLSGIVVGLFLLWPLLVLVGLATGFVLIVAL